MLPWLMQVMNNHGNKTYTMNMSLSSTRNDLYYLHQFIYGHDLKCKHIFMFLENKFTMTMGNVIVIDWAAYRLSDSIDVVEMVQALLGFVEVLR